jgi:hypothetical protein
MENKMKYLIETEYPGGKRERGTTPLSYVDAKAWVNQLNHKYPMLKHFMIEAEKRP